MMQQANSHINEAGLICIFAALLEVFTFFCREMLQLISLDEKGIMLYSNII